MTTTTADGTMPVWDEKRYALGVAEMDATHREFLDRLALLAASDVEAFPARFEALVEHTRRHFENESRLMRECRFPAVAEHENEHRRVLGELERMGRALEQGRQKGVRAIVTQGLPDWFRTHLATMDSALAACLRQTSARLPAAGIPPGFPRRAP